MKENDKEEEGTPIRPYNATQLAGLYGVCKRTFMNWIEPHEQAIGERIGRIFTAKQVEVIFEKIGAPD